MIWRLEFFILSFKFVFEKDYSILSKNVRFEVIKFKHNRKSNGTNELQYKASEKCSRNKLILNLLSNSFKFIVKLIKKKKKTVQDLIPEAAIQRCS